MDAATRDLVRNRAGDACEYCRMPQAATPFIKFHIEHIVARQHRDDDHDDPAGLALACDRCNAFKGPNLSSLDPLTGKQVNLFHPRFDHWEEHFKLIAGRIEGTSDVGRTTSRLLVMNDPRRVELRLAWLDESNEKDQ